MLATDIDSDGIARRAHWHRNRVCAGFDLKEFAQPENQVTDSLRDDAKATARVIAEAPQAALEATKRYLISSAG